MIFSNVVSWVYGQKITLNTILQDPVSSFYTHCGLSLILEYPSPYLLIFILILSFMVSIWFSNFPLNCFPLFFPYCSSLLFLSFFSLHLLPSLFLITLSSKMSFLFSLILCLFLFGLCLSFSGSQTSLFECSKQAL